MDEYIGTIKLFAFNFVPKDWAACNGQTISIKSNMALFALIGTTYGGDGLITFTLPDLRNCVPIGIGQRPGYANNINLGSTESKSSHGSSNFTTMGMNYCICIHGIFPPGPQ